MSVRVRYVPVVEPSDLQLLNLRADTSDKAVDSLNLMNLDMKKQNKKEAKPKTTKAQ